MYNLHIHVCTSICHVIAYLHKMNFYDTTLDYFNWWGQNDAKSQEPGVQGLTFTSLCGEAYQVNRNPRRGAKSNLWNRCLIRYQYTWIMLSNALFTFWNMHALLLLMCFEIPSSPPPPPLVTLCSCLFTAVDAMYECTREFILKQYTWRTFAHITYIIW